MVRGILNYSCNLKQHWQDNLTIWISCLGLVTRLQFEKWGQLGLQVRLNADLRFWNYNLLRSYPSSDPHLNTVWLHLKHCMKLLGPRTLRGSRIQGVLGLPCQDRVLFCRFWLWLVFLTISWFFQTLRHHVCVLRLN